MAAAPPDDEPLELPVEEPPPTLAGGRLPAVVDPSCLGLNLVALEPDSLPPVPVSERPWNLAPTLGVVAVSVEAPDPGLEYLPTTGADLSPSPLPWYCSTSCLVVPPAVPLTAVR